jgi:hypothetical protein
MESYEHQRALLSYLGFFMELGCYFWLRAFPDEMDDMRHLGSAAWTLAVSTVGMWQLQHMSRTSTPYLLAPTPLTGEPAICPRRFTKTFSALFGLLIKSTVERA